MDPDQTLVEDNTRRGVSADAHDGVESDLQVQKVDIISSETRKPLRKAESGISAKRDLSSTASPECDGHPRKKARVVQTRIGQDQSTVNLGEILRRASAKGGSTPYVDLRQFSSKTETVFKVTKIPKQVLIPSPQCFWEDTCGFSNRSDPVPISEVLHALELMPTSVNLVRFKPGFTHMEKEFRCYYALD